MLCLFLLILLIFAPSFFKTYPASAVILIQKGGGTVPDDALTTLGIRIFV